MELSLTLEPDQVENEILIPDGFECDFYKDLSVCYDGLIYQLDAIYDDEDTLDLFHESKLVAMLIYEDGYLSLVRVYANDVVGSAISITAILKPIEEQTDGT